MKRWIWPAVFLVPIILIASCVFAAILLIYAPWFQGWRQSVTQDILSGLLDRPTRVAGRVDVELGSMLQVSVKNVYIGDAETAQRERGEFIDHVKFSLPFAQALAGSIEINDFQLRGVNYVITEVPDSRPAEDGDEGGGVADFVSNYFNHALSGNLDLQDITIRYVSKVDGWNEELVIETLVSKHSDDYSQTIVQGRANLNGFPVEAVLDVSNPMAQSAPVPAPFTASLRFDGSSTRAEGTVDFSQQIAVLESQIDSRSDSLGDLLEVVGLKRVLEGTGGLSGRLAGPLNQLTAGEIDAWAGDGEYRFGVTGKVENVNEVSGFDVEFSVDLPKPDSDKVTFANIALTGFRGNITGKKKDWQVDDIIVSTNAAAAELGEIGPILIDRLTKDENGLLGMRGIHIIGGDPNKPAIDIRGDITDVLQLKGIDLDGSIDLAASNVLFFAEDSDSTALGRLKGTVAISDKDGTLGLEALEAEIVDSEVFSLQIALIVEEAGKLDEIVLDITLDIPDFTAFAAAVGEEAGQTGPVQFTGNFGVIDKEPHAQGTLIVGKTTFVANLAGTQNGSVSLISGKVGTDRLHLPDLKRFLQIRRIHKGGKIESVQVNENFESEFQASIDVEAGSIAGEDKSLGNVSGHVGYADRVVTLDPFQAIFLGGQIETTAQFDMRPKPPAMAFKGQVKKLQLGTLLKALGAPPSVTGTIYLNFDVKAAGRGALDILKSLSGPISASIWGGSIGTNLLDLTGLNVVTWLFSQSSKPGQLVCASLPFHFTNGRGATKALVIETANVQVIGVGSLDIQKDAVNMNFQPRAKTSQLVDIATPFQISGKLSNPSVNVQSGAAAGRAVAETLLLPLNALSAIFSAGASQKADHKPCQIPAKARAK